MIERRASRDNGPKRATWSIASTMRERPEVIAAFVGHHLAIGAERIFIFLDAPDPVAEAMLAPLDRCHVTVCDAAHWQRLAGPGGRPRHVPGRQILNMRHARDICASDWLLHIDSDEFLWQRTPLAQELAEAPDDVDWIRIPNAERILRRSAPQLCIFDGLFRRPTRPLTEAGTLIGPVPVHAPASDAPMLCDGFTGYTSGKIAIRPASQLGARLHRAHHRKGSPLAATTPPCRILRGTEILHFDGFTARHWTRKLVRRLPGTLEGRMHAERCAQLVFMRDNPTIRDQLFDRLMTVDDATEARLRQAGLILDAGFDPRPVLAHTFPGRDFDLSPAGFDRRLDEADAAAASAPAVTLRKPFWRRFGWTTARNRPRP